LRALIQGRGFRSPLGPLLDQGAGTGLCHRSSRIF
jgi:hypothetical protein